VIGRSKNYGAADGANVLSCDATKAKVRKIWKDRPAPARTISDMIRFSFTALISLCTACASLPTPSKGPAPMMLGNFSVSLAVKDLAASRAFYEKLGFTAAGGNGKNFLIVKNGAAVVGLFQGMFEKNMLTFNPGWDSAAQPLPTFDDVRDIQRVLTERGLTLATSTDGSGTGPASVMVIDPDGNPVLIDQHVPRPSSR
jgi:catechol 2,3-dioxygenase-like lactoylglutathione lyase family enzyme